MTLESPEVNLMVAWAGVLLGVLGGMVMGMFFHREDWLGGYGSFQRRMYRLCHISFFGLAILNFMFFVTAPAANFGSWLEVTSWGFLIGAATMPICCIVTAHLPKFRLFFAVPVLSLITASVLTVAALGGAFEVKPGTAGRLPGIMTTDASQLITEAWE